jgi:O-acetyl-ADP-ribose deacetylase (regulator of RNase III)
MIEFRTGDILDADVEALVNTVNCVGIMGRGIALQFKNNFPENFKAYKAACEREEVQPGAMFVFETGTLTNPKYIINFPTKRHWRGKSRIEDIESGLKALIEEIRGRNIRSIAIPPLGSGLGGLDWADVRPRIEAALTGIDELEAIIFEPSGAPVATKSREVPKMTAGRAALVVLMHRYLGGLMDPFVTLLEVHKLMYFMQEGGEPLRLQYAKALYGPYAENLRHVLHAVEGHLISGYADGGDAPDKQIELVPGAVKDAEAFLNDMPDTVGRFDRVGKLVEGFETPFGLELLATVHWVAARENATSADDVAAKVYAWNDRKKRFSQSQIRIAFEALREKGWLTAPLTNAPAD